MNLDKKIIAEIAKFNKVNKYIMEQDAAAVPAVPEDVELYCKMASSNFSKAIVKQSPVFIPD